MVENLFNIKNFNVVLTGATGYFGSEFAKFLDQYGVNLHLISRNEEKLLDLKKTLSQNAKIHALDLRDMSSIDRFCESLDGIPIHGLINNAYSGKSGSFTLSKTEDFEESFKITVLAAQRLIFGLIPNLKMAASSNKNASIVNISSMYGLVAPRFDFYESEDQQNPPFYGVSKSALIHLTKYLACELGRLGIRTNNIAPGPFPSPKSQENEKLTKAICMKSPMRRIGSPNELNGALIYLLSNASSYTNGSTICVDGGWTVSS